MVEQYQDKVFNTAISLVQDHFIAQDITQEVFVTLFKSILSFNQQSALSTWIYRITVNKCLDQLRHQKRNKRAGLIVNFSSTDQMPSIANVANFEHPGILLTNRENARYLFNAIKELPENQKTAFVLAHIEELPQKEIALIMKISIKAVESLLQRSKINLRKKLEPIYERRKRD